VKATDSIQIRNVAVTRLGLGSAPLGGLFQPVDTAVAHATVQRALDLGLRFFDTAPLYGYGSAETRVGGALSHHARDSFAVATKVGRLLRDVSEGSHWDVDRTQFHDGEPFYKDTGAKIPVFDFSYDGAKRSLEESLERLGLSRIDIAYVHDPDDHLDTAIAGAYEALEDLRSQGLVGAIGVGTDYTSTATRFVNETDIDCVLIAGRYTLLDQDALQVLLPRCLARGVSVVAAGVFNSGVLATPVDNPTFDYVPCPPQIAERALKMAHICREFGVSLKAAALQFPYRHPAVAAVVVGARTPDEIEENVRLAGAELPVDLWEALARECGVPLEPSRKPPEHASN
jgi:D-threo-aldose 1-dehydrogenase